MIRLTLLEVKAEAERNVEFYRKARRDAETRRENSDNNLQLAAAIFDIELTTELEKSWLKVYNAI